MNRMEIIPVFASKLLFAFVTLDCFEHLIAFTCEELSSRMNTSSFFVLLLFFSYEFVSSQSTNSTTLLQSNVTAIHDLEDPVYCSPFTWNSGWISVATNAFSASSACCGRRVLGWKLYDDLLKDLKGNPHAPPYCFFTKRLGSELVMKTLIGESA